MEEFKCKVPSAGDAYGGQIELKDTGSPHSINWENRFVPIGTKAKGGFLFMLFLVIYLFLITKCMDYSRFYFESIGSNYANLYSCDAI